MKITLEFLKNEGACPRGVEWFKSQSNTALADVIGALMSENRIDWASWLLCHIFNRKQKIQYAVFAADQVLEIFEKKFPNDDSPRKAIEAANAVLRRDTKEARAAAKAAAEAARAAADAADRAAADAADRAAADAAWAARAAADAAWAAWADAEAADSAAWAAWAAWADAAWAAWAAWAATRSAVKLKIILYGCSLLKIDTSKWMFVPKLRRGEMNRRRWYSVRESWIAAFLGLVIGVFTAVPFLILLSWLLKLGKGDK